MAREIRSLRDALPSGGVRHIFLFTFPVPLDRDGKPSITPRASADLPPDFDVLLTVQEQAQIDAGAVNFEVYTLDQTYGESDVNFQARVDALYDKLVGDVLGGVDKGTYSPPTDPTKRQPTIRNRS